MWDSWPSASAQSLHESRHSEGNPLMPSIPKASLPKRRFALDNAGASGFASKASIIQSHLQPLQRSRFGIRPKSGNQNVLGNLSET